MLQKTLISTFTTTAFHTFVCKQCGRSIQEEEEIESTICHVNGKFLLFFSTIFSGLVLVLGNIED